VIGSRAWYAAFGLLCLAAATAQVWAQEPGTFLQQQRQLEEYLRNELDRQVPVTQKLQLDWGGWFNYYTFLWDDGIESSRTLRRYDLRLWGSMSAEDGAHRAYVRLRTGYRDFNTGDSAGLGLGNGDDDWEGPDFERAWYQLDLAKALYAADRTVLPFDLRVTLGRQYVEFGTGYVLSLPLTAIWMESTLGDFKIDGLIATTPRGLNNLDQSRPESSHSDRSFYGAQVSYSGIPKHTLFAYGLFQEDQQGENPEDFFQEYDYDSFYAGVGAFGELTGDLRYSTEWVYEAGHSWGDQRFLHIDQIEAWAFDAYMEWLPDVHMRPRLDLEYMFASGDPNRLGSPTDAIGGNRRDHTDTGFNGFGYRDTGLSFAPLLSNVHIWRAGAAFFPFDDKVRLLENFELGTNWFLYYKNRSNAAVSDPTADLQSGYLGWEMDYYTNWRLTSDLSLTVRYGAFFPGDAFSDQTTRTFLLTGLTWSF
jgi:hypothetical protein